MKSFRVSKSEMLSHDNIEKAFLTAARGKRDRKDVTEALANIEDEISKVYDMLYKGTYAPRRHTPVTINEGSHQKTRRIIKPDYCYEQVVHHIIVDAIKDGIGHGMYHYVLGSIPKRGAHMGKKAIEKWLRTDKENTKYVLQMDIRHFFESIDHDVLKAWLVKKFRDKFLLELLFLIIDAVELGLPLGFYTSQWLANFLLQPLDHYIKETLHVKYMTRYADDIVCFGRNKKELHRVRDAISGYMRDELHLTMKRNWQVFRMEYESEEYAVTCHTMRGLRDLERTLDSLKIRYKEKTYHGKRRVFVKTASLKNKDSAFWTTIRKHHADCEKVTMTHGRALDYMGFEFHRDRTLMRESIMLRTTRKARQLSRQEHISTKDAQALLSSIGWVYHTDTYGMYLERIKPIVNIRQLKRVVSKHQKRINERRNQNDTQMARGRGHAGSGAVRGRGWQDDRLSA